MGGNTRLIDLLVDAKGRPDAIREDMNSALEREGAAWELRVQLCTDLATMPVEDASVVWDEQESPYRTVATITVEAQKAWIGEGSVATEDMLSFSPWHGIAAHRPLGGVNRVRQGLCIFVEFSRPLQWMLHP